MVAPRAVALGVVSILTALAPAPRRAAHGPRVETRDVTCGGRSYAYELFSPNARATWPAVLLLHGAGGRSSDLMDAWTSLAERERVVLIAPQIPRELWFEAVAPAVFRCLVEDAKRAVSVDPRRVYLFGYSMGGYLTFDGAMFASEYFAAAAVYAAAIANDYTAIVDSATRKIPIALYGGDRDPYYPPEQVQRTRDLLLSHGFPVHYVELRDQNHSYAPVADRVNRDAWTYLSAFQLPSP